MSNLAGLINSLIPQINPLIVGEQHNDFHSPFVVDLQYVTKVSLWDSINLLLIIETVTDVKKFIKIIFPKNTSVQFFLQITGFTDFLRFSSNQRSQEQGRYLSFALSDGSNVPRFTREYHANIIRIFKTMPTGNFMRYLRTDEGEYHAHVDISTLREWLDGIEDFRSFPLIRDGEFISFFGLQLVKNVEEHAKVTFHHAESQIAGFLGMRIIDEKSHPYFDTRLLPALKRAEKVLEVCIGDRGIGIHDTLCESYKKKSLEYGFEKDLSDKIDKHVLEFCTHELGTSKSSDNRIGSIHAIHRIMRSLAKYGGAIRIASGGWDIIYDLAPETKNLKRYTNRIGIKSTSCKEISSSLGTQIQIIIPLILNKSKPCNIHPVPPPEELFEKNHIIPVASYFDRKKITEIQAIKKLAIDTQRLGHIGLTQLIVYDFFGKKWQYEEIVEFFGTQADILARKRCVAIGIPDGIIGQISSTEKAFHDIIKGIYTSKNQDFFIILCDKQRILPILTIERDVVFLGFGGNDEAEIKFKNIFLDPTVGEPVHEDSSLTIFYKANEDLFYKKGDEYFCKVTHQHLIDARAESITENINEILEKTGARQKKGKYRLPTSNKIVGEFIWTLPVLENLTFNRQIGKWLAEGVWQKFDGDLPKELVLVCITAPAEMVARAIAKENIDIKYYIINLGYFGALDDDGLLTDKLLKLPLFIVSDLVRDGGSTRMVLDFLQLRWETEKINIGERGEICGLLSFLHLSEKKDFVQTLQWIPYKECREFDLTCFFVANVEKKKSECQGESYLIEPFSLKPYKVSLLQSNPSGEERIQMAEQAGVLRTGHWVAGKNHFKVTTCIPRIINNEILGGKILNEIGGLCIKNNINHLLIPFHSNIRHIIPKLRKFVVERTGRTLDSTYTVEARALAASSFYIAPKQLKRLIEKKSRQILDYVNAGSKGSAPLPLNFLIIDDAIYSARTLETILRALIRKIKDAYSSPIPFFLHPLITSVHYYAIIDRKGRAKGSLFGGIRKIYLFDDHEIKKIKWHEEYTKSNINPHFEFKFHNWIALDMPAETKQSCSLCKERLWLTHVKHTDETNIKFIETDIIRRLEKLRPNGIESPEFVHKYQTAVFKEPITIMDRKYSTLEGAIWELHTRRNRGCPYNELVDILLKCSNFTDENVEKLKVEICRMIFEDWKKFTANWAHKGDLKSAMQYEIKQGTQLIKYILPVVGLAYAMPDIEGREELKDIFLSSAERLNSFVSEDDLEEQKIDNLLRGLEMAWLYFDHTAKQNQLQSKVEELRGLIVSKVDSSSLASTTALMACNELKRFVNFNKQHPFVPSLLFLMDHTIRAIRHSHAHLIPSLLSRLIKSKPCTSYRTAKPFKKRSIGYFSKTLVFFAECLEIACRRDDTFKREIEVETEVIAKRCRKLASELQSWLGWEEDTEKDNIVLRRANMLAHIFPNCGSDIYTALKNRLASPKDLLIDLQERCQVNGSILLKHDENFIESKSQFIVHDREQVKEFFVNYLDESAVENLEQNVALMTLEEKPQHLILSIQTNFKNKETVNDPASMGHGMVEASTLPFALYDLNTTKVNPEPGYEFAVALKCWKGFMTRR